MRRYLLLIWLLLFMVPHGALACGPWIPRPYVVRNDHDFFTAPRIGFMRELEHLLANDDSPFAAVIVEDQAPNASDGLRASLTKKGYEEATILQILADYERYRQLLNDAKRLHDIPPYRTYIEPTTGRSEEAIFAALREQAPPTSLPPEFQLYLGGAREYYLGNEEKAQSHWWNLLELPNEARPAQTVRSAYMLARVGPDRLAAERYQRVREFAAAGFDDSDGLAAASYGAEAQVALRQEKFANAVDLYLAQWRSGYANAALSLQRTAGRIWETASDTQLAKLVLNDRVRALLTAHLLVSWEDAATEQQRTRFLSALPDPKSITLDEAGRFALLEYQQNNLSAARLWLEFAKPRDALALWVRSKLLLRDGHIDEGRTLLVELLRDTSEDQPDWERIDTRRAWGELGLLMLHKESYHEAAYCFVHAESWLDLAYVLERVMTLDELRQWAILTPKPEQMIGYWGVYRPMTEPSPNQMIARRLMREGQFDEALTFFPPELRSSAEAYISAMRQASNHQAPAQERARHYWAAARLMRDQGLDLFATELEPDFAWSRGSYDWPALARLRNDRDRTTFILQQPTATEEARLKASSVRIDQRFHYRFRAAQLAELAAGLLPNNDENAARIYCIAGGWLKQRDPQAANRLYQQLVVRCPNTELGQIAADLHWFPPESAILSQPFEG